MEFRNYSPDEITFVYKGVQIKGFQDGTFIDVERSADTFKKHVGSLGDVARTRDLDRTGKVVLTLLAQSPSNDILQAFMDADEQFGNGYGTLQITDSNGNMEVHASIAWIVKPAKLDRAKEAGATVWTFETADMTLENGSQIL